MCAFASWTELCNLQEMLQAGLIVAGWDKEEGGSVYAVPLGGTLVKCPFAIGTPSSPVDQIGTFSINGQLSERYFSCYRWIRLCTHLWLV